MEQIIKEIWEAVNAGLLVVVEEYYDISLANVVLHFEDEYIHKGHYDVRDRIKSFGYQAIADFDTKTGKVIIATNIFL